MSSASSSAVAPCPEVRARDRLGAASRSLDRERSGRLVLASSMVVSFLAASAAPTPLYDRYERLWHATPLIGTIAFAVYAFAVLVGLLWLGELTAAFGRRRVLLASVGGQVVALVLFAVAGSFAPILVGRLVQGLAAGAALGTLSAVMIESDADRGTVASAASPGAGSAAGAFLSGIVVQFLPGPTHTVYLILIAVLLVQALGVVRLIAPGERRPLHHALLRPRIAVPARVSATFAGIATVVFAVWGLAGFYAALSPALYGVLSHSASVWRSALGITIFAAVASASTIALRRASGPALTLTGAVTMLAGLALTVVAIALHSVALYFVASAVAGVGFGAGFQGPIRTLVPLVEPAERAGLLSAVFIVAYVGMGVPAVIAGALVSGGAALTAVAIGLAAVLAGLTGAAIVATMRTP